MARKKNPVPPSSQVQMQAGLRLFKDFTGHDGEILTLDKPSVPNVVLCVGYLDGVMYETVRDGKVEKYLHKFAKPARPLLCSSSDGQQLWILGGEFNFTERGIVDRKRRS